MFWDVVLFIILWPIGNIIGAFCFILPLICLRTGLPLAKIIQQELHIDTSRIKKKQSFTVVFWVIVDVVLIYLAIEYLSVLPLCGLLIGILFSLLLGIKKTSFNEDNLHDFIQRNISSLSIQDQLIVEQYLLEKFDYLKKGRV